MVQMSETAATAALLRVFECIAEEFDRDCPVNQPLAFMKVAAAGGGGMDQARLQQDMELSSAGVSRIVQALSAVHYGKEKEGFNVVERRFDPRDNRSRSLVLTNKGERVVHKLISALNGR